MTKERADYRHFLAESIERIEKRINEIRIKNVNTTGELDELNKLENMLVSLERELDDIEQEG